MRTGVPTTQNPFQNGINILFDSFGWFFPQPQTEFQPASTREKALARLNDIEQFPVQFGGFVKW